MKELEDEYLTGAEATSVYESEMEERPQSLEDSQVWNILMITSGADSHGSITWEKSPRPYEGHTQSLRSRQWGTECPRGHGGVEAANQSAHLGATHDWIRDG
jgi:hypothetical protein